MAEVKTGKGKWISPLLAGLLAVLALFAWKYYPQLEMEPSDSALPVRNSVYFGPLRSIAVLPFKDLNPSAGQEFWSVGLASELTRLLTLAPRLTVTSINSSLYFRGRPDGERAIAERLQVAHLLAGEYRISGETVYLNLRIYSARTNGDAWSRDYELDIDQLFGIQEPVLASVVSAMGVGKAAENLRVDPVDRQAWSAYLKGLYHRELRSPDEFLKAEEAFREALQIEPGYELARLALASTWLARNAAGDTTPTLIENARVELAAVLHTSPGRAEAHGLSSYISRNYDWAWSGALAAAEEAIRLNPGDPELMGIASLTMFSAGQFSRATALMEKAVQQDPLNLAGRLRLGLLQEFSADYEAALSSYRQLLGMNPDFPAARAFRARIKLIQQKPDSAMKESEQESDAFWRRYSEILVLIARDKPEKASILLDRMITEDGSHAAYQIAEIHAFQGDLDGALSWLNRAYDQRDGGMKELLGNYFLKNLHDDPRWRDLLIRMKLPLDLES